MAFNYLDKSPGDLIRSTDWNEMGREVTRLNTDKVDLAGNQTVTGPLTLKADLGVGTPNLGAQLRIYRKQEDGRDATTHGALVIGNDLATSATLRVGYSQAYSWLQGQGQQNLSLNPRGGDVGVGTDTPRSRLSVAGALAVGAAYASASAAPANSLIVEGSLGVGTPTPQAKLHVEGGVRVNGNLDVTGAVNFGQAVRQMLNLWAANYGIGVQNSTAYFRSDAHFAFYRGGTHTDAQLSPGNGGTALLSILNSGSVGIGTVSPLARLHVAAGDLRIDANQEILFADNGQIRSTDNNHRILFRRAENKLELREFGDIVFSPGATAGNETAKVFLRADGNVGIGTAAPRTALDTARGVMSGAANDYITAQFTLSGGGVVTYVANRLKWTQRFIAISANRGTSFANGYVDINQPTTDIPAANVWDGQPRSATADGVVLTDWDALYAVHTPGGGQGEVTYRIVNYKADFNAPSNWILVAVRNGDNGAVKLGTGEFTGRAITPAAGNSDAVGIMWPRDAHGGAGDAAWMRWYSRGGESTTLEIGTSNDPDDHIALMPSGSVGIRTLAPMRNLHVEGNEIHSGGGGAGYSFSNRESAFVDGGGNGDRWVLYSTGKIARLWSAGDKLTVDTSGTVTASAYVFGNGSTIGGDQGGCIELGGNNGRAGTGVPYIDFHFGNGRVEDYNARIISDGDGMLTVYARMFRYNGNLVMASSRELKDGIEELGVDEAQRIVRGLTPVRYHMKADETRTPHLGFIAEDVPEQVAALERKAISPNHIIAALTRVVNEQQRRIDELARRIEPGALNA